MPGSEAIGSERGNSPSPLEHTLWWEGETVNQSLRFFVLNVMQVEGQGHGRRYRGALKNSYCFFGGKFISWKRMRRKGKNDKCMN